MLGYILGRDTGARTVKKVRDDRLAGCKSTYSLCLRIGVEMLSEYV
jgi:hypothetical protein